MYRNVSKAKKSFWVSKIYSRIFIRLFKGYQIERIKIFETKPWRCAKQMDKTTKCAFEKIKIVYCCHIQT